jgi:hypothetical protein
MERRTRIWISWLVMTILIISCGLAIIVLSYPSFGKAVLSAVVLGPIIDIVTDKIRPRDHKLFKKTL